MKRWLILLFLWMLTVGSIASHAMLKAIVVDSSSVAPTYTGPGDITTYTVWYGFRAYNAAKAAANVSIADLRRTSDNASCTLKAKINGDADLDAGTICNSSTQTVVGWLTRGTFTGAAISGTSLTFSGLSGSASSGDEIIGTGVSPETTIVGSCTVSPCTITPSQTVSTTTIIDLIPSRVPKVYDQVSTTGCGGSPCDPANGTALQQPTFIASCKNSRPCMKGVGSGDPKILTSANSYTPNASADISLSAVANRSSGTQNSGLIAIGTSSASRWEIVSGNWRLGGAANVLSQAQANGWHAANGVIDNGGTDTSNIDGTEATTSALAGSTTAQTPQISMTGAFGSLTVYWAEGGWQDNTLWDSTVRTGLCNNQRLYWGTPGSC